MEPRQVLANFLQKLDFPGHNDVKHDVSGLEQIRSNGRRRPQLLFWFCANLVAADAAMKQRANAWEANTVHDELWRWQCNTRIPETTVPIRSKDGRLWKKAGKNVRSALGVQRPWRIGAVWPRTAQRRRASGLAGAGTPNLPIKSRRNVRLAAKQIRTGGLPVMSGGKRGISRL
jgi:hypothetical protein